MQSFLVSTGSFDETAQVLDNKRLNKQTLEAWQCLMTMTELDPQGNHRTPKGWSNHPVVKMWRGYETALLSYIESTYKEWISRGYKSTMMDKSKLTYETAVALGRVSSEYVLPPWMSDTDYFSKLCSTHRTALLCKNYDWYKQFGWSEDSGQQPETYEYMWPHLDGFVLAS